MARFMLVYRSQVSAQEQMANADPAQARAGMDAWMAWAKAAGEAIVDLGMPLGGGRHLDGSQGHPERHRRGGLLDPAGGIARRGRDAPRTAPAPGGAGQLSRRPPDSGNARDVVTRRNEHREYPWPDPEPATIRGS